jgi:AhpD family alkylhydroperoxidase
MAPLSFEPPRMDVAKEARAPYRALIELGDSIELDPPLRELINLRASILNGCAYCVDMHTKDARAIGETEQRLYGVAVWRETPYFGDRERAALAWTETVTRLSETHVPDADYAAVAEHFQPAEVAALTALIVTINAWNAISVSTRAWEPGSYQP